MCRKDTNILKSTEYKDSNSSITEQTPQLLLPTQLIPGPVERYIELYRLITQRTARLVAHWLRVGYIQGNMNSDNILLSGVTIDYEPYGWMEQYDRNFQPFTGDKRSDGCKCEGFRYELVVLCVDLCILLLCLQM